MGPGIWQLLIVLVIILLLFGTKKLRNVGKDLGGAIKGFKDASKNDKNGDNQTKEIADEPTKEGTIIEGEVEKKEKDKV